MTFQKQSLPKYDLDANGTFVIENYNQSKPFSNFFPGVAGLWGTPMWVFYVNRGQAITSFGVESKDKAILEFLPANKAYRQTSIHGFRTFIKITDSKGSHYWEPFQISAMGSAYAKTQILRMNAHDLVLIEENQDLGLTVEVTYFTMPQERFAALARRVKIVNKVNTDRQIEIVDGLPAIMPYGLNDWVAKHMCRTVEAWVKVRNVQQKAPYYHLNVEVADTPEVVDIKEGNFFFSFLTEQGKTRLLDPIVNAEVVFGRQYDFIAPEMFLSEDFSIPEKQQTSNRTPAAMNFCRTVISAGGQMEFTSLFGYAASIEQLNEIVKKMTGDPGIIQKKSDENQKIIDQIKDFAFTKSSARAFDLYVGHTFLDNILRGGLPISLKAKTGNVAFNVYSRKHGDIERDYNFFMVAPTCFSQGNGNYRDVNQNRRNDVWFNTDVRDTHLVNFLNLIQADGYNPLVVKGTSFYCDDPEKMKSVIADCVAKDFQAEVLTFVENGFLPGRLMRYVQDNAIPLKIEERVFLGRILEICHKQELADHGEGFWADHWTYNLDLIESYLSLYPEDLKDLLMKRQVFSFYHNDHFVQPRDKRYRLTPKGVRQYGSVRKGTIEEVGDTSGHRLRVSNGGGAIYQTHLACKLICLIANKIASLDPSGIGVEMEADKPCWYDALNGLPGLLGSSVSETLEIKRFAEFLLTSFERLRLEDKDKIKIFDELRTFVFGLTNVLAHEKEPLAYWKKSNEIKELYRQNIRKGIDGKEEDIAIAQIRNFLQLVVKKINKAVESATDKNGFLATYLYHEVTEYDLIDKEHDLVRPKAFRCRRLPDFLEGYVHALKAEGPSPRAKMLYQTVRQSGVFDRKLGMYKVNADISSLSTDVGRARVFPSGWLENESVWLHMEYKFMLELLRCELYEEFYDDFQKVMVPFMDPNVYGRSILENSSFLASSAHEDGSLHGQGFVARLSGSTAEVLHIWLFMNMGKAPFEVDASGELMFNLRPILPGWLFTESEKTVGFLDCQFHRRQELVPANAYAFNLFNSTLIVYHNPKRKNTFGKDAARVKMVKLIYASDGKTVEIQTPFIPSPYAADIRDRKIARMDVILD